MPEYGIQAMVSDEVLATADGVNAIRRQVVAQMGRELVAAGEWVSDPHSAEWSTVPDRARMLTTVRLNVYTGSEHTLREAEASRMRERTDRLADEFRSILLGPSSRGPTW